METTTINPDLVAAYRWHRQHYANATPRGEHPNMAAVALELARVDVAAGKRRYPSPIKPYAAVSWKADNARGERIGFVQSLDAAGLRHVGDVPAECGSRNGYWNNRADKGGWYTDPFGDVFKDGTGLCWGAVYQLPSRNGKARFVAGYVFGGCSDDLPSVDFGTIYESDESGDAWNTSAADLDAAMEAARAADSMASIAAEHEREYQTAWQAGSMWADRGEEIAAERKSVLQLLAEFKSVRHTFAGAANVANLCAAIREKIESGLDRIRDLRAEREKLAAGDWEGGRDYALIFYPSEELKAAFNDGAGKAVL